MGYGEKHSEVMYPGELSELLSLLSCCFITVVMTHPVIEPFRNPISSITGNGAKKTPTEMNSVSH